MLRARIAASRQGVGEADRVLDEAARLDQQHTDSESGGGDIDLNFTRARIHADAGDREAAVHFASLALAEVAPCDPRASKLQALLETK
jgi:uncharacterized protein HemY